MIEVLNTKMINCNYYPTSQESNITKIPVNVWIHNFKQTNKTSKEPQ